MERKDQEKEGRKKVDRKDTGNRKVNKGKIRRRDTVITKRYIGKYEEGKK